MYNKRLWSVGGGKGGIGKSILTLGLGISLARMGKKVVLIDCDLGGANLHTLMGMRYPQITLEDFFLKRAARLEETVQESPIEGLGLICGADDILGAANPTYAQKIRLLKELENLPAQYIFLDLGAGSSLNMLDFFNYCVGKIVLFTPQTTSLQNAYGFIKNAIYRKLSREFARETEVFQLLFADGQETEGNPPVMVDLLAWLKDASPERYSKVLQVFRDFQVFLVVNMVKSRADLKSLEIIQSVCADFLNIHPEILGHLEYDPAVEVAVNRMQPFPLAQKRSRTAVAMQDIALKVLKASRLPRGFWVPEEENPAASRGTEAALQAKPYCVPTS